MSSRATGKQIAYAMALLRKCGYPTDYMTAGYKGLHVPMQQRRGRVRDWLAKKSKTDIGALIGRLKKELEGG